MAVDDFVNSRQNVFPSLCNLGSVDLDPVELVEDVEMLKKLIEEFHLKTGSLVAKKILAEWSTALKRFVKVRPK